ncbi:OmpA family protein [Nisaea acidiphila]|uniref:OmpA family protein n=1 Tax=Nisaea acidiphila TaxID=1862145 RepID=A0A9J7AV08_9PROT|nr:OmpA family protein [Nisaea acidiphila]UUX49245.1 OmpA family protein [Nisaea acidiphila]
MTKRNDRQTLRGRAFALLLACSVGACALGPYDTEELKDLPPPDSLFLQELSRQYVELGDMERAEYDWPDTARFYDRAIRAAKGEIFEPEQLSARYLDPAEQTELSDARTQLASLFSAGARSIAGPESARGQAGFDCWIQELEEGHQPADIAYCRAIFVAAVSEIEAAVKGALVVLLPDADGKLGAVSVDNAGGSVLLDTERASALVAAAGATPRSAGTFVQADVEAVFGAALAASPAPPVTFVLYFEQGTDNLTSESRDLLATVSETITRRKLPQVEISGHTDRAGTTAYNDRLALDRARIVNSSVLGLGVPARVVAVESYGERAPIVPTADGVSEPRNRRVEIVIR